MSANKEGPRILATPKITAASSALNQNFEFQRILANGSQVTSTDRLTGIDFTDSKLQFHGKDPVMLHPGRSHVLAFENDANFGISDTSDGFLYNDKVRDLTVQSVYRDLEYLGGDLPDSYDMKIRMELRSISLHHGVNDNRGGGGHMELFQTFWAPFAWDIISGRPGKVFDLGTISATTLNENKMASLDFNLRTTREPSSGIRPLVDANIRCMLGNTRWDSPLGLPVLAGYQMSNQGEADEMIMQMSTVDAPKGYTYWGAGRDPSSGHERVILFDIPRADLFSLGQLQHAGAGRFSYEPSYVVGNSYANPRISPDKWKASITDAFSASANLANYPITGSFNIYDSSYLVNERLWDGYTFTTIPQVADNATPVAEPPVDAALFTALANNETKLPNARYLPYTPGGSSFDLATLQMTSSKANGTGAFYHNAGHLLVDGAFNVNSTSVDAWEAFLSSTHSLPYQKVNEKGEITGFEAAVEGVRFPRVHSVFGEGVGKDSLDENFWIGFRELSQPEVRALAEEIVVEIKARGPFLGMADFVNRKLDDGEHGKAGALQAALDRSVNSGIDSDFADGEQGTGFPGQLLQGDILQSLAPYMTVRSDVFTIRAYGEARERGANGKVLAKAWCEAKVQRFPDPVESASSGGGGLAELSNPSSPFGRKFRVVSFRWLNPDEI